MQFIASLCSTPSRPRFASPKLSSSAAAAVPFREISSSLKLDLIVSNKAVFSVFGVATETVLLSDSYRNIAEIPGQSSRPIIGFLDIHR